MGKKKGKKGKKGKKVDLTLPGNIPSSVSEGFAVVSKALGSDPAVAKDHTELLRTLLEPTEDVPYWNTLKLDNAVLGPGGTRALCHSLLGVGPGLTPKHASADHEKGPKAAPGPLPPLVTACYQPLEELHMIENRCMDAGAVAVASLLTPQAVARGVTLKKLTIKGDHVGYVGAEAIAVSLSWPVAPLTSLVLDYLPEFDDTAVRVLCHGLVNNGSLRNLSMAYGGYGADAMRPVCQLLKAPASKLASLSLRGNFLGPAGLRGGLSEGLGAARSLDALDLSACGLGRPVFVRSSKQSSSAKQEVANAWQLFVDALSQNLFASAAKAAPAETEPVDPRNEALSPAPPDPKKKKKKKKGGGDRPKKDDDPGRVRLRSLNLLENNLMPDQGEVLAKLKIPEKGPLMVLKVDITLPDELFKALWRNNSGKGGKKGKKKKKK